MLYKLRGIKSPEEEHKNIYENHEGYFYNINKVDEAWAKIVVFTGDHGRFVKAGYQDVLYVGGFQGSYFNTKIGKFRLE